MGGKRKSYSRERVVLMLAFFLRGNFQFFWSFFSSPEMKKRLVLRGRLDRADCGLVGQKGVQVAAQLYFRQLTMRFVPIGKRHGLNFSQKSNPQPNRLPPS